MPFILNFLLKENLGFLKFMEVHEEVMGGGRSN